ncbi:MAG: hypothetical protein ISS72_02405 [Candidatus Brocadiae bacterium]|nr:hypothetical protein [Candidatus Brocadiia bacterium]
MTTHEPHRTPPGHAPSLPLLPLTAWAVALLAYHAVFLARMAGYRTPLGPEGAAHTPSYLALTLEALPHILVQGVARLPIAFLSLAVWGVALGAGMALLRWCGYGELKPGERAVFGGGVGMGILSLGTLLAGVVAGRPPWLLDALLVTLLVAMAIVGFRDAARALRHGARALRAWRPQSRWLGVLTPLLGLAVVLLALTRANVPVFSDYDSLEYHLAAPAQWWRAGRITFLRDMVYSNFPQNVEMLQLLAMSCFGGPLRGAVVGLQIGIGFVVLTAGAIAACGRRLGSPAAGRAGAALFLATPMLGGLTSHDSYVVELPLAAYAFLALYAGVLLWQARDATPATRRRLAILCGAMAGLAIGCKYPALLFVFVPVVAIAALGAVVDRQRARRALGEAAIVGAVALAVAGPWFVRNAVNTGNPTYPLLYSVFGGSEWSPRQDAKFARAHRPAAASVAAAADRLWRFAVWRDQPQGDWQPPWRAAAAPLLLLFGMVPLMLGGRHRARAVLYVALLALVGAGLLRFASGSADGLTAASRFVAAVGLVAFVASPLLLWRRGAWAIVYGFFVFCFVAWYVPTHRLDRFLDPATPALALVAGLGVASVAGRWPRRVAQGLVAAGLAFSLVTTVIIHVHPLYFGLLESPDAYLSLCSSEGSTYSHATIRTINELPADAVVLFVGEARTFYSRRRVLAASVFDRQPIDRILEGKGEGDPARRVRDGLRALGVTHIYFNWPEISRLGRSYAYRFRGRDHDGLSDYLNAEERRLFAGMVQRGTLRVLPIRDREDREIMPVSGFILCELR